MTTRLTVNQGSKTRAISLSGRDATGSTVEGEVRSLDRAQEKFDIHWVTLRYANGIVNNWHSYLPPTHGGLWSLGAFDGAECVGVIIVSRPKARRFDNGLTAEVCRVATNGYPNAASALLGRARRVCHAMGFRRLVSYTRASESGTSYKAAGWTVTGETGGGTWNTPMRGGKQRRDALVGQPKLRWEVAV